MYTVISFDGMIACNYDGVVHYSKDLYADLLTLFVHVHYVFTNFHVIFSWINNDLEVALVGTKVDLTYDYDVSQEVQCKIKTTWETELFLSQNFEPLLNETCFA